MKKLLWNFFGFIICLSCICGMCNKDDEKGDTGNNNNTNDPVLLPDSSSVYFQNCPSLVYYYPNNNSIKKLVPTKVDKSLSLHYNAGQYLVWNFENSGDARFLRNADNPANKETFSISLKEFNKIPGPGTYQMHIDYKEWYCLYDVYTSTGAFHDSTGTQSISNSQFNITSIVFDRAIGSTIDRYKMTGNSTFNIMYWANGTGSTSDIHTLHCKFNNIPVDFMK